MLLFVKACLCPSSPNLRRTEERPAAGRVPDARRRIVLTGGEERPDRAESREKTLAWRSMLDGSGGASPEIFTSSGGAKHDFPSRLADL